MPRLARRDVLRAMAGALASAVAIRPSSAGETDLVQARMLNEFVYCPRLFF